MLMNVVLPAPLEPISPTTESLSIAALTSCAAVTAPKRLHRPRASSMTGMASKDRPQAFREKDDQREEREPEAHLPGVRREPIGERVDRAIDQRADEGRNYAAGAGEDGDEDEFARGRPVRHVRIDVPHGGGGERAA